MSTPKDQDRYYVQKVTAEIERQPMRFVHNTASKALWVIQNEEIRDSHSYWFFRSESSALRLLPTFGLVFPFAAIGLLTSAMRWTHVRSNTVLVWYLFAMGSTCVGLVVGYRYRLPITPVLIIYAVIGAESLWRSGRRRAMKRAAIMAATGILAVAITNGRSHVPSHNFAEEWAFVGSALNTERNLDAATQAYRRSLDLNAGNGYAWNGLGIVSMNSGRWAEARNHFEKAVSIDQNDARANYYLGLTERRLGDLTSATFHLNRALAISPDKVDVLRALISALLQNRHRGGWCVHHPSPCHTTGHAGPHPAVRRVEVTRAGAIPARQRTRSAGRC